MNSFWFKSILVLMMLIGSSGATPSSIDGLSFENPVLEDRYRELLESFRCPVCQNTSLAGSDAPTARDLRQRIYQMLAEGHSDAEIRDWISERYGDFVLYSPPVQGPTLLLWFGPLVLFLVACLVVWRVLRRGEEA